MNYALQSQKNCVALTLNVSVQNGDTQDGGSVSIKFYISENFSFWRKGVRGTDGWIDDTVA